jgi:hypothetical protein
MGAGVSRVLRNGQGFLMVSAGFGSVAFGPFVLCQATRELRPRGESIHLTPEGVRPSVGARLDSALVPSPSPNSTNAYGRKRSSTRQNLSILVGESEPRWAIRRTGLPSFAGPWLRVCPPAADCRRRRTGWIANLWVDAVFGVEDARGGASPRREYRWTRALFRGVAGRPQHLANPHHRNNARDYGRRGRGEARMAPG